MNRTLPAANVNANIGQILALLGGSRYWALESKATPATKLHHIERIMQSAEKVVAK